MAPLSGASGGRACVLAGPAGDLGRRHLHVLCQGGHLTQAGERFAQETGDVSLGDAQLLGDLSLAVAHIEVEVDEPLLSGGELLEQEGDTLFQFEQLEAREL